MASNKEWHGVSTAAAFKLKIAELAERTCCAKVFLTREVIIC